MDIVMPTPADKLLTFGQLEVGKVYQSGQSNSKVWLCVMLRDRETKALIRLSDCYVWSERDVSAHKFVEVKAKVVIE